MKPTNVQLMLIKQEATIDICKVCQKPIKSSFVVYGEIGDQLGFPDVKLKASTETSYHIGICSKVAAKHWDARYHTNWGWKIMEVAAG